MHGDGHGQEHQHHPETGHKISKDQKRDRRHHHIDDEEIHRHASKHLRAGERAMHGMADQVAQVLKPLPRQQL